MKKKCVVCGKDVETDITADTEVFAVTQEPCICSTCTMTLFAVSHGKEQNIKEYKKRMEHISQIVLSRYPDKWDGNIEDFIVEYLMQTFEIVGKEITIQEANTAINSVKARIEAGRKEYKNMGELSSKEKRRPTSKDRCEDDFTRFSSRGQMIVSLEAISRSENRENSFKNIIGEVKETVKGQDEAVEEIGRVIFHNQKCIKYNRENPMSPRLAKQNALVVGNTGSGKTLIITEFCRILDIPYVIADMTAYTKPGYVGGNIEDIFLRLLEKAEGDYERAQNGLIMLDEGDKNESKSEERGVDVGGKGITDSLLKKIEGCEIDLGKGRLFDSTNTTFFLIGVFPRLYEIRRERVGGKRKIGFCAETEEVKEFGEFISDDFERHGFSQEYIGRFASIVELNSLSDEVYLTILNSKNSPYFQYKRLFKYAYGVNFEISEEGKKKIIERAKSYNIGARGLLREMARMLKKAERDLLMAEKKCKKVKVDENCEIVMI